MNHQLENQISKNQSSLASLSVFDSYVGRSSISCRTIWWRVFFSRPYFHFSRLVSLTSVLVSGAIPLTPLLLARLRESYGQAPSRGRRGIT